MLERYLVAGGLAGSYMYQDETLRRRYLEDIYSAVLTRDLVQRYRLSGAGGVLESVSAFLLDNVGNVTSAHRLCGILNAQQRKTNPVTIGHYLDYLCSAFLFYPQHSFDVKGSAYLKGNIKYYLADLGVRYAVQGQRNLDYGRAYENMAALELLRRGYQVYTGKMGVLEVDFVALQGSSRWYIQVCDNLDNPQTFEREVTSLLKIKDAYPKVVLARTAHPPYDYKRIAIVDLASYLAGKVLKEADPTLAWYQR
ncbi:MAG: ATP-binding protein [Succinivibrio sp.]|nr:ATP-binding protein [Succinivibrio sp.]